jgi:hypothetical protein
MTKPTRNLRNLLPIAITRLISSTAALGTFYFLALHAYRWPIFRGEYIRAQAIENGQVATLTVFAGTNVPNLLISLSLSICAGVLFWPVFKVALKVLARTIRMLPVRPRVSVDRLPVPPVPGTTTPSAP